MWEKDFFFSFCIFKSWQSKPAYFAKLTVSRSFNYAFLLFNPTDLSNLHQGTFVRRKFQKCLKFFVKEVY